MKEATIDRIPSVKNIETLIHSQNESQTTFAPEPSRDWAFGPITGHRLLILFWLLAITAVLYLLQTWIWPPSHPPLTPFEIIWSWGSFLWLGAIIPGTFGLIGLLRYRHPENLDAVKPISSLVSFRIVSRGTNIEALTNTIKRCQKEMASTPLFPYIIEVVTDVKDDRLPSATDTLKYLTVPKDYITPNKTLYKARALHYALQTSSLPDNAWIVHLDEESQPTSSGIKGICAMIDEEETSGEHRIGQGAILYHRKWRTYPFLTLADNVRTGDDFARFHLQHKIGVTIFGMHGSYIVVRNDIEKSTGFDVGPQGSITEDAFWALIAMERGHRCRWVEGYIEEQSTQSIGDFIKQRRRWFQGLAKVSLYAPVSFKWRFSLGLNTLLWTISPFAIMYTVAHIFYGVDINPIVRFLANYSFASFEVLYLIGLKANLDEYGITSLWERFSLYLAQIVLLPVFSLMESAGVIAAIVRPVPGFHVVKK